MYLRSTEISLFCIALYCVTLYVWYRIVLHLDVLYCIPEHECHEGDNHVPCGGPVPECISPLFVCDGIKDCKNGRDESKEICSGESINQSINH